MTAGYADCRLRELREVRGDGHELFALASPRSGAKQVGPRARPRSRAVGFDGAQACVVAEAMRAPFTDAAITDNRDIRQVSRSQVCVSRRRSRRISRTSQSAVDESGVLNFFHDSEMD